MIAGKTRQIDVHRELDMPARATGTGSQYQQLPYYKMPVETLESPFGPKVLPM